MCVYIYCCGVAGTTHRIDRSEDYIRVVLPLDSMNVSLPFQQQMT